jgi:hypothetical protein
MEEQMKRLLVILLGLGLSLTRLYAEDKVVNLGENEKIGEVLVLSEAKIIKLMPEQKSIQGLCKLGAQESSPIVWYDEAGGRSAIGFVGSNHVAFATNHTLQSAQVLSDAQLDAIFNSSKPIAYSDFQMKYDKNADAAQSSVPVRAKGQTRISPARS